MKNFLKLALLGGTLGLPTHAEEPALKAMYTTQIETCLGQAISSAAIIAKITALNIPNPATPNKVQIKFAENQTLAGEDDSSVYVTLSEEGSLCQIGGHQNITVPLESEASGFSINFNLYQNTATFFYPSGARETVKLASR